MKVIRPRTVTVTARSKADAVALIKRTARKPGTVMSEPVVIDSRNGQYTVHFTYTLEVA